MDRLLWLYLASIKVSRLNQAINQILNQGQYNLFSSNLNEVINNPTMYGITTVDQLNEHIFVFTQPVDSTNLGSDIAVNLIDRTNKRIVRSELFDVNNNWKGATMYHYNTGTNSTLKGILQRAKHSSPFYNCYTTTTTTAVIKRFKNDGIVCQNDMALDGVCNTTELVGKGVNHFEQRNTTNGKTQNGNDEMDDLFTQIWTGNVGNSCSFFVIPTR